jgi:amino acid/amide ABC transporter ATP-binding protein 2, HAAT family (TC 3.A.1.4.-)
MLRINSLGVKFGSATIISDVSFQVSEKSCVSIIGANGAGKTTLLKTISGIVTSNAGEIEFEGINITGKRPDQIVKMGIAHCPEGRRVFPAMTVRENLELGGLVKRSETERLIGVCCELFPRLGERIDQLAGTMSGGEQQMLAIARALMSSPKIVMFDEPSLGLAPNIVEEVGRIILDLKARGHTILLVEQNAFMAMSISDYTYVLENGEIKKHGPSSELLNDDYIRQAYLGI